MSKLRIKDIAARLGVSAATVSRALGNTNIVAEPTRSRIRDLAQQLNYRPNVNARNLRTRKSKSILMVVRDIGNPFYLEILKGVESTARAAGYSVLMGNTENDPALESEYFNMLKDGHADGMILMTGKLPEQNHQQTTIPSTLPVVVALEIIEHSSLPHVQIDNQAAAKDAVQHLIGLGHTRIAHISGPTPEIMSLHRRSGYRQAMQEARLEILNGYEQRGEFTLSSGGVACQSLVDLRVPPTAIFVANDEMAFGAINVLRQRGMDVPTDVSVIGFDNLFFGQAFYPPLTTVSQPRNLIGRQAMAMLLELLSGNTLTQTRVILPTHLNIRSSTAPLPEIKI